MGTITIHYEIHLPDGSVFDSSYARGESMEVDLDAAPFPELVNRTLKDLKPGDKSTLDLSVEEGYGERDEDLVFKVDLEKLPGNFHPEIGGMVNFGVGDDELLATVVAIEEPNVVLDGNHPLAGVDLKFVVERLSE